MNLRKESMIVYTRNFKPYLEMAIRNHPTVITVKIVRGNVVTAHDYARRVLIQSRRIGIGKYTAAQIRRLRPPIRVYYSTVGIAFAGVKRRNMRPTHWDEYKTPFDVLEAEDNRWVTLAIEPSADEIHTMGGLMAKGVLPNPIELRTRFTPLEVERALDIYSGKVRVFKNGRCTMLWPRQVTDEKPVPIWERVRRAANAKRNGAVAAGRRVE